MSSYAIIVAAGSKIRQNKVPNRRLSAHPENRAGTHKEVYMRSLPTDYNDYLKSQENLPRIFSLCQSMILILRRP